MEFAQRFHTTARTAWESLICGVIQPCSVYTGVPSLCQPQASDTKASSENVCVCFYISGWGTHQPAAICSFQGSQIADNRLGKQSKSSGSQFSSTVNHLHRCQILFFVISGQSTLKRLTKDTTRVRSANLNMQIETAAAGCRQVGKVHLHVLPSAQFNPRLHFRCKTVWLSGRCWTTSACKQCEDGSRVCLHTDHNIKTLSSTNNAVFLFSWPKLF